MSDKQEKWSKNLFFILATIGAAVGLGNLWRFPYIAHQNGGGSFFIPFICCYLLVGLPIIYLEFGMGLWSRGSVAQSFKKLNSKTTWIGWWILLNSIVIVCYYAIVMAWCLQYAIYSLNESWGADTKAFFFGNVTHITDSPFTFGSFNLYTIGALLIIWVVTYFVLRKGLKALSKILLVTVPVPFLLIVVLAGRAVYLPGGIEGVRYFLKPELSKVFDINVWSAAAGQVILSLSLGMGQMVAYSSMKRNSSDNLKSGLALIFGDFMFSLFSGIAVFATYGAMQYALHQPIADNDNLKSLGLAFITYPQAISSLPFAPFWGFMFFFMLVLLGIDSVFAVVEANLTDLRRIFPKVSKQRLLLGVCVLCFLGGLPFTLGSGLYWLDIVDHWVGEYAIFSIIILQCLVFGSTVKVKEIAAAIGKWMSNGLFSAWRFWIVLVIPVGLGAFIISKLSSDLFEPYSKYPWSSILLGGWGVFSLAIVVGIIISIRHNRNKGFNESQ